MTRQLFGIFLLTAALLSWTGCEIVTEEATEAAPDFRPAGTVVINEVFTLPPTVPNPFSWIEFMNASDDTVDVTFWTMTMTTNRLEVVVTGRLIISPDTVFFEFIRSRTTPAGYGPSEVPIFATSLLLQPGQVLEPIRLPPRHLRTYVNNENALLSTTQYGPDDAPGEVIADIQIFQGPITRLDTLGITVSPDSQTTTLLVNITSLAFTFSLATTDQLVVKDENGQVQDVVRYGNYVWPGPDPDPYPGNQSIGVIPLYESIARYADGYSTGNTASDFYFTSAAVRPVPHWYSALIKRR